MLRWHEDNADVIGQSVKLNADCMLHAALEEDREMLAILYSFGYRLGLLKDTVPGKYAMKWTNCSFCYFSLFQVRTRIAASTRTTWSASNSSGRGPAQFTRWLSEFRMNFSFRFDMQDAMEAWLSQSTGHWHLHLQYNLVCGVREQSGYKPRWSTQEMLRVREASANLRRHYSGKITISFSIDIYQHHKIIPSPSELPATKNLSK